MVHDYVRVYQRQVTNVSAASFSGSALVSESNAAGFGANLITATQAPHLISNRFETGVEKTNCESEVVLAGTITRTHVVTEGNRRSY
jgi:hypothetical protein